MSTVAAISTPNAAGGIGMIRLSGEDAIGIASKVFFPFSGKKLTDLKGYSAAYGAVKDGDEQIDDAVAVVYRAPKSYTGENVAEICCHGGLYLLQKTLRLLLANGAEPAGPGEFTKRAFLNGKLDLTQAESVMKVISAQGEGALKAAEGALQGSVSRKVGQVCDALVAAAAALAAWADYPDEEIPAVENAALKKTLETQAGVLQKLLSDYDRGKAVTEGVKTAICGKPNVGKSTLMNLLSGFERSIVTPVSGTTRDVVEETVRLGDVLLRLMDTAGIHETDDAVEAIGVRLARDRLEAADLVIAVFDASRPFDEEDEKLLESLRGRRVLPILNKGDLPAVFDETRLLEAFPGTLRLSAKDETAPDAVKAAVEKLLGAEGLDFNAELLVGERQRDCCRQALEYLNEGVAAIDRGLTPDAVSVDVDCAVDALLTLTGKKATEEIVSEVFRTFCVGK